MSKVSMYSLYNVRIKCMNLCVEHCFFSHNLIAMRDCLTPGEGGK